MTKPKFFFEMDPEGEETTTPTPKEQAGAFNEVLSSVLGDASVDSFEPMESVAETVSTKTVKNGLIEIEYGIIKDDYVIHITPLHPKLNFSKTNGLNQAIIECVKALNGVVPFDLRVEIHPPQQDWEVKALSFVIRGGASAWNLDRASLETITVPELLEKTTQICQGKK